MVDSEGSIKGEDVTSKQPSPPPNKRRKLSHSSHSSQPLSSTTNIEPSTTTRPVTLDTPSVPSLPSFARDAHYQESKNIDPTIREMEVGITCFTSDSLLKFSAVLKQRYTDFIVNEIAPDGKVLHFADEASSFKGNKKSTAMSSSTTATQTSSNIGAKSLHFLCTKQNRDSMEVANIIAKQAGRRTSDISFAGTKDRRAVTTQAMSINGVSIDKMKKVSKNLHNAKIGNFEHKPHPLELGELEGNCFTITLRDCQFKGDHTNPEEKAKVFNEALAKAVDSLMNQGFLNYFGLQRFGTYTVGTEIIGMYILQGNYKAAVDAILHVDERELAIAAKLGPNVHRDGKQVSDDVKRAAAIQHFNQDRKTNASQSAKDMPWRYNAEGAIMRSLGQTAQTNFVTAIQSIPRKLLTLYLHAYQSFIWNHINTWRFIQYGSTVRVGDLILVKEQPVEVEEPEFDDDGEVVVRPASYDAAVTADVFQRARALTKEEAESGNFTIFDIVLPTPGFDVEYPLNDVGDQYMTFMKSGLGGGLDPSNMRRSPGVFSLSGSYRSAMIKPRKVSATQYLYADADQQLARSDMDTEDPISAASNILKYSPGQGFVTMTGEKVPMSRPTTPESEARNAASSIPSAPSSASAISPSATSPPTAPRSSLSPPAQPVKKASAAWQMLPDQIKAEDAKTAAAADAEKKKPRVKGASECRTIFHDTYVRHDVVDGVRRRIGMESMVTGAVVELDLPSSTYATMALRELSHGGIQQ